VGPSNPVRRAASSGDDDATAAAAAGSEKSRLTWTRESLPRHARVLSRGYRGGQERGRASLRRLQLPGARRLPRGPCCVLGLGHEQFNREA